MNTVWYITLISIRTTCTCYLFTQFIQFFVKSSDRVKTSITFTSNNLHLRENVSTLYHIPGNFRVVLFSQILQTLLSRETKFYKILPCHTFYVAHIDHLQKYFLWNYWNHHFRENLVTQKFPSIQYVLTTCIYISVTPLFPFSLSLPLPPLTPPPSLSLIIKLMLHKYIIYRLTCSKLSLSFWQSSIHFSSSLVRTYSSALSNISSNAGQSLSVMWSQREGGQSILVTLYSSMYKLYMSCIKRGITAEYYHSLHEYWQVGTVYYLSHH